MLGYLMSYPNLFFRFIRLVHAISKRINRNVLCVPYRIFFSGLHLSSMNGFCKNWKWPVFLPFKTQSTQCGLLGNFLSEFSVFFKLFIYVLKLVSLNFEQKFFSVFTTSFFRASHFFFLRHAWWRLIKETQYAGQSEQ